MKALKAENAERIVSYVAADGLVLSARDAPGAQGDSPCVLCLHGLTRNGRDFDGLAAALSGGYRVIRPDQRGRGLSAYDPNPLNYNIVTQTQDMWGLLDALGVETCAIVGTSMGGLMGVLMAGQKPERVSGLVLNDVGPEVDPRAVARIAAYVGADPGAANWDEAAAALKRTYGDAFPTYTYNDWMRLARASFREEDGKLRLDYDPMLATALKQMAAAPLDLWPAFDVLQRTPALILRGALSDVLSEATLKEMKRRYAGVRAIEVAHRGHAPDLTEPEAAKAISAFLGTIGARR